MRHLNFFTRCMFVFVLCTAGTAALYAQEEPEHTVTVHPVEANEFPLSSDGLVLFQHKLEHQFTLLGNFQIDPPGNTSSDTSSDIMLFTEIKEYAIESDGDVGFIVRLEILHSLKHRGERTGQKDEWIEVKTLGTGESSFAALLSAVEHGVEEFRRKLLQSALLAPGMRVLDSFAGRVIINQGEGSGVKRGYEYKTDSGDAALLKVAAVYPELAEAHVLYGRDILVEGALLEKTGKIGMRWALEGSYHQQLNDEEGANTHRGGITSRVYFDRGFFSLSPMIKTDILFRGSNKNSDIHAGNEGKEAAFFQLGSAVNWHAGRFMVCPAVLAGVGVLIENSDEIYWGGSIELGLTWRINRRFFLVGDIGGSGWYYTGADFQNARFLSMGVGFMLKY